MIYRYAVWLRRPSTAMLNRRGWDAFRARKARNAAALPALVGTQLLAQTFIRRRSRMRWLAHQLVFWGCILAALDHVPAHPRAAALRERRPAGRPLPGVRVAGRAPPSSTRTPCMGWVIFHGLDIAAVLVLAGVFIFLRRRLHDPGALAVERSGDFLALAGLFAVSVTGLFLTVSSTWLHGQFYSALNTIHALTVILGLMYLPFGKLFHIFQRPGNLGVAYYKTANAEGPEAVCRRCGEGFASAQQVADLQEVLAAGRVRLRHRRRRQLPGHVPAVPTGQCHLGPVRTSRRLRLMARIPITEAALIETVRAAPQRGTPGRMGRRPRDRQGRRDPLLLLRSAVRHQAEGPRQRGRRVRALVRLPVQRRQALPQGREALPPGQSPRPAAAPDGARRDQRPAGSAT